MSVVIVYVVVRIFSIYSLPLPLGMGVHPLEGYIQSLLLVNYITGVQAVNGVTWTLLIEVVFYALTALFINKTKADPVTSTYCFIISTVLIVCTASLNHYFKSLSYYVVYVFFLLLGRIYYFSFIGRVDAKGFAALFSTCSIMYISLYDFMYPGMLFSAQSPAYAMIYSDVLAIVLFISAAVTVKKINKFNLFMADVSYSTYLLHLPIGGGAMVILDKYDFNFGLSFLISLLICFFASYLMFVFIERPSQVIARNYILSLSNKRRAAI